jgi:hypothetical protein
MAITSEDDLTNALSAGQTWKAEWNKNTFSTTAHTAGLWYSLFRGAGNPSADTILGTGTNLAFQALRDDTTGATGIRHGGDVSPSIKHILNASAVSAAATSMPAIFMLVDLLGFYPITTVTSTSNQTLDNTVTLPRYTDGAGVQAFITPTTVMGAATPNIDITYTNSAGTASRATPTTLPLGNSAAAVTSIVYSGTGSGKYGPFLPLAAGDAGIRSIQNFHLSASYLSGVLNLVVCKPLLRLPMTTIGVASEREFKNQIPSLPRVYDEACLAWLMYAGAATPVNSSFNGHVDFVWG